MFTIPITEFMQLFYIRYPLQADLDCYFLIDNKRSAVLFYKQLSVNPYLLRLEFSVVPCKTA